MPLEIFSDFSEIESTPVKVTTNTGDKILSISPLKYDDTNFAGKSPAEFINCFLVKNSQVFFVKEEYAISRKLCAAHFYNTPELHAMKFFLAELLERKIPMGDFFQKEFSTGLSRYLLLDPGEGESMKPEDLISDLYKYDFTAFADGYSLAQRFTISFGVKTLQARWPVIVMDSGSSAMKVVTKPKIMLRDSEDGSNFRVTNYPPITKIPVWELDDDILNTAHITSLKVFYEMTSKPAPITTVCFCEIGYIYNITDFKKETGIGNAVSKITDDKNFTGVICLVINI